MVALDYRSVGNWLSAVKHWSHLCPAYTTTYSWTIDRMKNFAHKLQLKSRVADDLLHSLSTISSASLGSSMISLCISLYTFHTVKHCQVWNISDEALIAVIAPEEKVIPGWCFGLSALVTQTVFLFILSLAGVDEPNWEAVDYKYHSITGAVQRRQFYCHRRTTVWICLTKNYTFRCSTNRQTSIKLTTQLVEVVVAPLPVKKAWTSLFESRLEARKIFTCLSSQLICSSSSLAPPVIFWRAGS